jgi:hypothetical protein
VQAGVAYALRFFAANLAGFYFAGRAGLDIGFVYYVWVGVFGVTIVAQFWAHATDLFDVTSGQRLFPAIMLGATLGGLVGPAFVPALFATLGPLLMRLRRAARRRCRVRLTRRSVPEVSSPERYAEPQASPTRRPALIPATGMLLLVPWCSSTREHDVNKSTISCRRLTEEQIAQILSRPRQSSRRFTQSFISR